jgi:hypothetical protein
MGRLIYSMGVSLDGFISGPSADIGWADPDEELHRFYNEQGRVAGVHLYGRGLYEAMRYWETAEDNPDEPGAPARVGADVEGDTQGRLLAHARGRRARVPARA